MTKTVITNVFVFDGKRLNPPCSVIIDDGVIGENDPANSSLSELETIDGTGHTLLPGLIDCHVRLAKPDDLDTLARHGITTAIDMGAMPHDTFRTISETARDENKATTYRSCGMPAISATSDLARCLVAAERTSQADLIGDDQDGEAAGQATTVDRHVNDRLAEGAHHITAYADVPGLSQEQLTRLATLAREKGKPSIARATHYDGYVRSQSAGFDVLAHVPADRTLGFDTAQKLARHGGAATPTLSMMGRMEVVSKRLPRRGARTCDYRHARASVGVLRKAGVPILAGSDSNMAAALRHPHGESLWLELELLVDAGLTPVEALGGATALAARHFGLSDRGEVRPGLRADLVLVEGNPCERIEHVRRVRRVWSRGSEVDLSTGRVK
ncbi:hypothetical protein ACRALDRAFT_1080541 [Sodiomyces alcalophilus JCM 7366]|uniref:uncharacterized protein n=1 Tax=Sodiomyces alcalophilus JCM 7366 TaxID=591952 RepID=UPI0039B605A3